MPKTKSEKGLVVRPVIKKSKSGRYISASGMSCPVCHFMTKIIDTRGYWNEDTVRRRRVCVNPECGYRFSTYESVKIRSDIIVSKRNGSSEPFDLPKLEKSLSLATNKYRMITKERIHRIGLSIAQMIDVTKGDHIPTKGAYRLVDSKWLAQAVMESLKELDPISYIRYASIHYRFYSLDQYQTLLDSLG